MLRRKFVHFAFATAVAASAAIMDSAASVAREKITLTELNWTGATAINAILKEVMERYLDVDVEMTLVDGPVAMAAMDKGDGSIDVLSDFWSNNHGDQMTKYILPGGRESVAINANPYFGKEGLWVPDYVYDDLGIRKTSDLSTPENAAKFAEQGGKAKFWAGALGWPTEYIYQVHSRDYGYDKYFDPYFVDQEIFEKQLVDAVAAKKPVVFYMWSPEWVHAAYKLHRLEEPPFTGYANEDRKSDPRYNKDGCYKFVSPNEDKDNWLANSFIRCEWPPTAVHVAYSKALSKRAPKVAQFLNQVSLDANEVSDWILDIARNKKDPDDLAKEWVETNKVEIETVWLKGLM